MNESSANLAAEAGTRRPFQVSLLSAFRDIAQTCLKTVRGNSQASLQSYLDGGVAVGRAYCTRRAVLLAVHDMREDLEVPRALQEKALAELLSLKVRPTPELKLYRDIATALLRMEVVIRLQAIRNGETMH